MRVEAILQRENILLDMDASSKEEAIGQLTGLLYKSRKITDIRQFSKDVFARESLGYTGIGKGIAIPHGITDTAAEVAVAIGRMRKEINWTSGKEVDEENRKVKLVILFAVPKEDERKADRMHIEALKTVMSRLADHHILQRLIRSDSKEEVIGILGESTNEKGGVIW